MMQSGSLAAALAMAANLSVQSRPLRVKQPGLAVFHPQLHAIAVELDLMHPVRAGRRLLHQPAELGLDEVGQGCDDLSGFRRGLGFRHGSALRRPSLRLLDCHTASALKALARMKGLGLVPVPFSIASMARPDATE